MIQPIHMARLWKIGIFQGIVGLLAGVFVLDLLTPRGWAVWILYLVPLLLVYLLQQQQFPYIYLLAASATVLTVMGLFFSPPGGIALTMAIANRALGISVLWAAALFLGHLLRRNAALYASEEEFRSLCETTPSAIFIYQGNRILYANQAAALISGYTVDELFTMDMWQMAHPDFLSALQARALAAQEGDIGSARYEFKIVTKRGEERWLDFSAATISFEGRPARIATGYDITERKQGEAFKNLQQKVLEAVATGRALPDILTLLVLEMERYNPDMIGSVLLLDDAGRRLHLGAAPHLPEEYSRAIEGAEIGPAAGSCGTACHRKARVIVTDIAADPLWADYKDLALPHGLRACWSEPIVSGAGRVLGSFAMYYREPRAPDRDELNVILTGAQLAGIAIERRQAETALQRAHGELEQRVRERTAELADANAYIKSVMDASTEVAIIAGDPERKITVFNTGAEKMLGYRADEMVGKHLPNIFHLESEVKARGEELTAQLGRPIEGMEVFLAIPRQRDHEEREWTYVRKDGRHLTVNLVVTAVFAADGRLTSFLGMATDITARKRMEEVLKLKSEELEEQYRRVQEANSLKSKFLASMSHELRTPLNAIIGFTELIHDGKVGSVSPQQKEFLGDILTSSHHLLQLINDVLDLAKVESGKMEFRPEPVDLERIVGEVRDILRGLAGAKRIRIHSEIAPQLGRITTDPAKLKQVIYNYLSNALKFTPDEGRVTVRVKLEGADAFRLEVEDTGIGVKQEDRGRLFIEFQQLDARSAKKCPGTGLGLALTKRIVEAQGGRVGMESAADGRGSVFFAVLPRVLAPQSPPVPVPPRHLKEEGLWPKSRS